MIIIHTGCFGEIEHNGMIVKSSEDYIFAREKIKEHIMQDINLDIYILNRVIDNWFWDLEKQKNIKFVSENPVEAFKKMLSINYVPDFISPELIMKLELLNEAYNGPLATDPIIWILTTKLGEVWATKDPSLDHIKQLALWWFDTGVWKVNNDYESLINKRLDDWVRNSSGIQRILYQQLKSDFPKTSHFLCAWSALFGYEIDFKKRLLSEREWYIPELIELPKNLIIDPIPHKINESLKNDIQMHWSRIILDEFEDWKNATG